MEINADLRAYQALSEHARAADLALVARSSLARIAITRRIDDRGALATKAAAQREIAVADATTEFGNVLDVLGRNPQDEPERALARAIAARVVALGPSTESQEPHMDAEGLLWLSASTPFDATGLLDVALGDRAAPMWEAIGDCIRRFDRGVTPGPSKGEALLGAAALASSGSSAAKEVRSSLRTSVRDPMVLRALSGDTDGAAPVQGGMATPPRRQATTAVLAVTGALLFLGAARLVGRALAYKRPAQVELSEDGSVRVRWRVELLGRTLRDRDVVVPRTALVLAAREVRYQGIAFYAGLLSLVLGSYVGVSTFVDGARAASPSLLAIGLALVALGVGIDFALTVLVPAAGGRCRLWFVPRTGAKMCVGEVDVAAADAFLERLTRTPGR